MIELTTAPEDPLKICGGKTAGRDTVRRVYGSGSRRLAIYGAHCWLAACRLAGLLPALNLRQEWRTK